MYIWQKIDRNLCSQYKVSIGQFYLSLYHIPAYGEFSLFQIWEVIYDWFQYIEEVNRDDMGKKDPIFLLKKLWTSNPRILVLALVRICGDGWISLSVLYPCLRSIAFTLFSFLLHAEASWAQAIWLQNQLCQEGVSGFKSYIFSVLRHMIYSGFPSFFSNCHKNAFRLIIKNFIPRVNETMLVKS